MVEPTEIRRPVNRFPMDVENAPKISLAGMEFPIPVLVWKQNRVIEPLWWEVAPVYYAFMKASVAATVAAAADAGEAAKLTVDTERFMNEVPKLSQKTLETLATIVYTAITRATPGFSQGEFDNMPIGGMELLHAVAVILPQTGIFVASRAAPKSAGEPKAGEADAGNR